jgi:RNA polymerase sigma-70 factor (sigma-E family)
MRPILRDRANLDGLAGVPLLDKGFFHREARMADRAVLSGAESSRTGFSEYVVARRALMYRTAWVLSGDLHQAEDLVQQVLTKLYVAWPRVSRVASVDGYVRTMLVNANLDRIRRRRELPGLDGFDQPARELDHDALLDLRTALGGLAPGQRRTVVLRHLWGLSVDETAAELGVSPGTVKSQTADAVRRLRETLASERGEGHAR